MEKLPKYSSGFTLVELLISIAIIAVLTAIGFTIYQGIQGNSRDAQRTANVNAIADAMESAYKNDGTGYVPVTAINFAGGVIPQDPTNTNAAPDNTCPGVCKICTRAQNAAYVAADFKACAVADITNVVPPATPTTVSPAVDNVAPTPKQNWMVCVNLEKKKVNNNAFYCRQNKQ